MFHRAFFNSIIAEYQHMHFDYYTIKIVYAKFFQIIEISRACCVYDPRRKTHQEIYFVRLDNDSACAFCVFRQ